MPTWNVPCTWIVFALLVGCEACALHIRTSYRQPLCKPWQQKLSQIMAICTSVSACQRKHRVNTLGTNVYETRMSAFHGLSDGLPKLLTNCGYHLAQVAIVANSQ